MSVEPEPTLEEYFENEKKTKKISLKLIESRNLTPELINKAQVKLEDKAAPTDYSLDLDSNVDLKARALFNLTHVHLDREQIDEIDNLAVYLGPKLTNLYLQYNQIKRVQNLESLTNLKFLCLANNQIEKVENLLLLTRLQVLDLSANLIDHLDVNELPVSLSFLDLRENPCIANGRWQNDNYENRIRARLNGLLQLNGEFVDESAGDVDDQNEHDSFDFDKVKESIINRSKDRQKTDVANFNRSWQQKKYDLNSLQNSFESLKFKK